MSQHWDPLQDLLVLQDRMNRLFEDATQRRTRDESESDQFERGDWTPLADVYEAESSFVIAMDVPGISREALELELDDNRLIIKGSREIEELKQHRTERPHAARHRWVGTRWHPDGTAARESLHGVAAR